MNLPPTDETMACNEKVEGIVREVPLEGILLVDKPIKKTSFFLVHLLRKKLGVRKIGHTGTLDPFATGLMVLLVGRRYTKLAEQLQQSDKTYVAELFLGKTTDTYDCEGKETAQSSHIPSKEQVESALLCFQGKVEQIPPMFSAKKQSGKRLYQLARQGKEVERAPVSIHLSTEFLEYAYPYLRLRIACSKGTYIRSIAHDLGQALGCGAHLTALRRTLSGAFTVEEALSVETLLATPIDALPWR